MKVTDDRNPPTLLVESFNDIRDGLRSFVVIDSDADDFAASASQRGDLLDGAGNIRSVGIGHGLHHNWCIPAHPDTTDYGGKRFSALDFGHIGSLILPRAILPALQFPCQKGDEADATVCPRAWERPSSLDALDDCLNMIISIN